MTVVETAAEADRAPAPAPRRTLRQRSGSAEAVLVVLIAVVAGSDWLRGRLDSPAALTFLAMLASILLAGLPFLVAGAAVSAGVTALLPVRPVARLLAPARPDTSGAGAFVAALTGVRAAFVLAPGTYATVAMTSAMLRGGLRPAAVVAFLAAAPVVNPVALVATAVAFPGEPALVAARFVAGAVAAAAVGWFWARRGIPLGSDGAGPDPRLERGWPAFWTHWRRDVVRGATALAVGGAAVAGLTALCPPSWVELVALRPAFSVVASALLALLLCAPGEANAVLAAALTPFSATARLVFLTVGPLVDVRRFAEQTAALGPRVAVRLAPLLFGAGLLAAVLVGGAL